MTILSKTGNVNYLTNDLIYLVRIGEEEQSHYIYIKCRSRFFNLSTQKGDKDKRFCPICNEKVNNTEYNSHISKGYRFAN